MLGGLRQPEGLKTRDCQSQYSGKSDRHRAIAAENLGPRQLLADLGNLGQGIVQVHEPLAARRLYDAKLTLDKGIVKGKMIASCPSLAERGNHFTYRSAWDDCIMIKGQRD